MKSSSAVCFSVSLASLLLAVCCYGAGSCLADTPLRNWPLTTRGDLGNHVRALQLLLTAHGCRVTADGSFGRATQKALRQFQSGHGLITSGETNNPTWEALIVSVHPGSKGPTVQAAQVELRTEGYAVATDGVFDARMKSAVQKFQRQTGHTADGVVGRNTWYELVGGEVTEGD